MKRRGLFNAGLVATIAALIGACSATPGTSSTDETGEAAAVVTDLPTDEPVELTIWTAESGTRLELLKALSDDFSAEHPNITVTWVERDFGTYNAQLKLALASDEAPDLANGNIGWSLDGELVQAGLVRPLDDYAKAYGWADRYPEVGLRQLKFTPDGKTWGEGSWYGLPYAADVIGWFYNKQLLADLGAEVPTTQAELEDLFAQAKDAGITPIMLGNKDQWPGLHLFFTVSNNAATVDQVAGLVYGERDISWTDPEFVSALDTFAGWQDDVIEGYDGFTGDDALARFGEGEALFFAAGSWNTAALQESLGDDVGFFLTPPVEAGDPPRATGSFGWGIHITTASEHPDEAAAWLDFITNDDAATRFIANGDIPPVPVDNPDVAAGTVTADIFAAWTQVQQDNTFLPYLDFATPTAGQVLYPGIQSVLAGQQTADETATAFDADRTEFLDSLE